MASLEPCSRPSSDLNTVRQPPPTRAPSYRQAFGSTEMARTSEERRRGHAIRAATPVVWWFSNTAHGSAARCPKRVSSVQSRSYFVRTAGGASTTNSSPSTRNSRSPGYSRGCVDVRGDAAGTAERHHTSVMNSAEATALPGSFAGGVGPSRSSLYRPIIGAHEVASSAAGSRRGDSGPGRVASGSSALFISRRRRGHGRPIHYGSMKRLTSSIVGRIGLWGYYGSATRVSGIGTTAPTRHLPSALTQFAMVIGTSRGCRD